MEVINENFETSIARNGCMELCRRFINGTEKGEIPGTVVVRGVVKLTYVYRNGIKINNT